MSRAVAGRADHRCTRRCRAGRTRPWRRGRRSFWALNYRTHAAEAGWQEVFAADDTMRNETAMFNATLQAGYFILAVRACGLAAGPMRALTRPASTPNSFLTGASAPSWSSTSVTPAKTRGSGDCRGWPTTTCCGGFRARSGNYMWRTQ